MMAKSPIVGALPDPLLDQFDGGFCVHCCEQNGAVFVRGRPARIELRSGIEERTQQA